MHTEQPTIDYHKLLVRSVFPPFPSPPVHVNAADIDSNKNLKVKNYTKCKKISSRLLYNVMQHPKHVIMPYENVTIKPHPFHFVRFFF